jgi:hypothetical protein
LIEQLRDYEPRNGVKTGDGELLPVEKNAVVTLPPATGSNVDGGTVGMIGVQYTGDALWERIEQRWMR